MDGAGKVAAAIVFSSALVVVTLVAYREFDHRRDVAEARAALQELATSSAAVVSQAQAAQLAAGRQRARGSTEDLRRRALGPGQRCVGGAVVQVSGATYTQVGTIAEPVRCSGGYADRPLR